MKKLLRILGQLFLMGVLVHYVISSTVFAQAAPNSTPKPTVTPAPVIYVLPYPGILPTHPLYFLKKIRDQIIEALIADPINKADFYMLQADKKIAMAVSLKNLGEAEAARTAFAESLSSRQQSVALLESQASSKNTLPRHVIEKLALSLAKHKEVLIQMGERSDGVDRLISRVQTLIGNKE